MSLFPAYGDDGVPVLSEKSKTWSVENEEVLLASEESEPEEVEVKVLGPVAESAKEEVEFYEDLRGDRGHRHVSTLYPPGRPLYVRPASREARAPRVRPRPRPLRALSPVSAPARRDEVHRAVAARPDDPHVWAALVRTYEDGGDAEGALRAARDAVDRLPNDPHVAALALDVGARHLPAAEHAAQLHQRLSVASGDRGLWARLILHTASAGPLCSEAAVRGVVSAALARNPNSPELYLDMFYAYATFLRLAGLVETLVLLVQLAFAMNVSPVEDPPQPTTEREAALLETEEAIYGSGLPTAVVWGRVERARGAVRWAPLPPPLLDPADPQRSPAPADLADLLRPLVTPDHVFTLSVHCLRALGVPLLGDGGWELSAFHGPGAPVAAQWEAGDEAGVLAAVWARGGAPSSGVGPVSEQTSEEYRQWVGRVWDAAERAAGEAAREALRVWRVRWLGALWARAGPGAGVRATLRREAAEVARRAGSALVAAEVARLDGPGRVDRVSRAALRDPTLSPLRLLWVVRDAPPIPRQWYVVSALCRVPLPDDLSSPPPSDLIQQALTTCRSHMEAVEAGSEPVSEEGVWGALLPGGGLWARGALWLGGHGAATGGPPRYREEAALGALAAARDPATLARGLLRLYPHNRHIAAAAARGTGRWAVGSEGPRAAAAARVEGAPPREGRAGWLTVLEERAHHVGLYWRTAAAGATSADTLADLVLLRGLRLRALPQEISYNLTTAATQHQLYA